MKKLPYFVSFAAAWLFIAVASAQENPVDYKSVRRNDELRNNESRSYLSAGNDVGCSF